MSYTPDKELLEDALEKFILASENVRERMNNRLESDDWNLAHKHELVDLSHELHRMELTLKKLKEETR